jgi:hypothetical protein
LQVIIRREVLEDLDRENPTGEFANIIRVHRGDQTAEGSWKRKRKHFEEKRLDVDDSGSAIVSVSMTPTTPWFLGGGSVNNRHLANNWFHLRRSWFTGTSDELSENRPVRAQLQIHPAIAMGFHYSLRWYWMEQCECRGIQDDEDPNQGWG